MKCKRGHNHSKEPVLVWKTSEVGFYANTCTWKVTKKLVQNYGLKYHCPDCKLPAYTPAKWKPVKSITIAKNLGYLPCSTCFPIRTKESHRKAALKGLKTRAAKRAGCSTRVAQNV